MYFNLNFTLVLTSVNNDYLISSRWTDVYLRILTWVWGRCRDGGIGCWGRGTAGWDTCWRTSLADVCSSPVTLDRSMNLYLRLETSVQGVVISANKTTPVLIHTTFNLIIVEWHFYLRYDIYSQLSIYPGQSLAKQSWKLKNPL